MKYRTGLLLGAAFAAGIAAAPASGLVARHLGIEPAFAQDVDNNRAETYRLLTLFGDVFERVRAEYVDPVSDRKLIDNALNGMLTGLDPHSDYMDRKEWRDMQVQTRGEFGGLGLEVTQDGGLIKVVSPIDDTPAAHAGIKPGDLITAIDHKTVEGISLNQAVDQMRGPPDSTIHLTLKRAGINTPIELTLTRQIIHIQVVKSRMFGDIGYVRLTQFNEETDPGLRKAISGFEQQAGDRLAGVVLDLRNNPGGLLDQAVDVSSNFLNSGEVVSTKARHPEDSQRWDAKAGGDITHGVPLVVLINGGSASASEIVAGALQDQRRAVLVGTRSFGKGSVQTVIPLPGNGAMRLTTARYYTPSGRSIQGLGISPDVPVAETPKPVDQFGPERELDLNHTITNEGGTKGPPPRTDLPAIVHDIPAKPPANWPKLDAKNPATDFQLQQALVVVRAMAAQRRVSR
ncbi:MAG TPA: S41 family peptidase [Acetobacteraceae bacterium]|jgi:carboxyl-terminal processing protease|nr:S41 family peptidase [Acetobacteraceae bacterium]